MQLFEADNYKIYVQARVQSMPLQGRGQYLKIAKHLGIGSVNVSQIFKGDRHLTLEQALEMSDFFGHTELESQYFLTLVSLARAGSVRLKARYTEELRILRMKSQNLKDRLSQDVQLSAEAKAVFYSNWYYSGIRLCTSLAEGNTIEEIAARFHLPAKKVGAVLEFLVNTGLCKQAGNVFSMGPRSTHLEAQNPLVAKHHTNWRLKAISQMESPQDEELFLTMPCSLSREAFDEIRRELVKAIQNITDKIDLSSEEELACLNIDFFKF